MSADGDDLSLRITGVESAEEIDGARRVRLRTTRGEIAMVLHEPVHEVGHEAGSPGRAALCLSGALGGLDGPCALYPRLGAALARFGVALARLDYRIPNEFGECVLDAMAGLAFLKALRHERVALIGHSFGGAVAINAGTLSAAVTTVVAISSQLFGAHVVAELAPRPLLLLHGSADTILPPACSEQLYERAREPKTLRLLPGAGHRFAEASDELLDLVQGWIRERV